MADLLGSILGQMEKPPTMGTEERKRARDEKLRREKIEQRQKEKLNHFRAKMQKVVNEFIKDIKAKKYKFQPMEKVYRAILHEVTDIAGLSSFSFGEDEIDRYVMVWKKEFAPCDDELTAYRNGEEWNPEKHKMFMKQKRMAEELSTETSKETQIPNSNYQEKYQRIFETAAASVVQTTSVDRSYGMVSSENKRDRRTIEEIMADNKARKKLKTDHQESTDSSEKDITSQRTDHDREDN